MDRWSKLLKHRLPKYRWFQRVYGRQHRGDFTKSAARSGFPHRNTQHFVKKVAKARVRNKQARRARRRNRR